MGVSMPIRQMSTMEARRALIVQVEGCGMPGQDDLPADHATVSQLSDELVTQWTDEFITKKYNYELTIRQIVETRGY